MSLSVEENFAIIYSPLRAARHFIDRQRERASFLDFKQQLNLRAVSLGADIATLSGGISKSGIGAVDGSEPSAADCR